MSFVRIKAAHSPDVTARNLAEYLTAKLSKRMPQWGKKRNETASYAAQKKKSKMHY